MITPDIITNKKDAGIINKAQIHNIPFFYMPQQKLTNTKYYEKE